MSARYRVRIDREPRLWLWLGGWWAGGSVADFANGTIDWFGWVMLAGGMLALVAGVGIAPYHRSTKPIVVESQEYTGWAAS